MRILIGVEPSSAATTACQFVAGRSWPIDTSVSLVTVVGSIADRAAGHAAPVESMVSELGGLEALLDERAAVLRRAGMSVETIVERGDPAHRLIELAQEKHTDLIVVGSRGLGPIASAVLGSVSAHLVDHAPCPVLVVRSPSAQRMLLASDGTDSSIRIPRVLATWGNALRGLPVEVISVAPRDAFVTPWAPNDDRDPDLVLHEGIAEQVADELMELGWHSAAVARAGDPARQILAAGDDWGADLIVTGSRGLGTLGRLARGSVAHDVLMHGHSTLLVMRGLVPAPIRRALPIARLSPV
jgi:nucleotide-binding universal stress UspA family protein